MLLQSASCSLGAKKILDGSWSLLKFSPAIHKRFQSKGNVASKTPTKITLEAGKVYQWCACGYSKKQPLCDGSHKNSPGGMTPITFQPQITKEYFFCNCKQTNKRPLCDGTHKKL